MFQSILYESPQDIPANEVPQTMDCLKDLNLDQIFTSIIKSTNTFDLSQVLYRPLTSASAVIYRQEIMRDFDTAETYELFLEFSRRLHALEQDMAAVTDPNGFNYDDATKSRCLEYADRYRDSVSKVGSEAEKLPIHSRGLRSFLGYLSDYCHSTGFQTMCDEIDHLKSGFAAIHFCIRIKNGTIYVRPYEGQDDLNPSIAALFSRFQQKDMEPQRREHPQAYTAHHIDAAILSLLSHWHKELFAELDRFVQKHLYFLDDVIVRFSKEVHFYLSWHHYIAPLQQSRLPFCYPQICDDTAQLHCTDGFDLALAKVLSFKGQTPVTNDFCLKAPEQMIVVTGPNQGGKTTFARAFGQLFYLASLGCSVPGSSAAVYLPDRIYTHFSREEDLSTLNGKLQDDLLRLHDILVHAGERSLLIINEIFSSTTLQDALFLGRRMVEKIIHLGCPAVCVTFLDELASYDEHTVSMMSTVNKTDPTIRTYKVIRKSADGLAYAAHIAQKYHLTYQDLSRRLQK